MTSARCLRETLPAPLATVTIGYGAKGDKRSVSCGSEREVVGLRAPRNRSSGDQRRRAPSRGRGYPGIDHKLPSCCRVMRSMMRSADEIVRSSPKGYGATLTIRYHLPRARDRHGSAAALKRGWLRAVAPPRAGGGPSVWPAGLPDLSAGDHHVLATSPQPVRSGNIRLYPVYWRRALVAGCTRSSRISTVTSRACRDRNIAWRARFIRAIEASNVRSRWAICSVAGTLLLRSTSAFLWVISQLSHHFPLREFSL
jgi:hypothetical protein